MTKFEKIIIPFLGDFIKPVDLTEKAGFVDSYTFDPDRPNLDPELFLVYKATERNEYTIDRARRFELSMRIKYTYIKTINNVQYVVYSFWINPEMKKLFNRSIYLTLDQKIQILQFWGSFETELKKILEEGIICLDTEHPMPIEDYRPSPFELRSGSITKRVTVS